MKLESLRTKSMSTIKYYQLEANGKPCRWVKSTRAGNRDTMQLFKRFVYLYGSSLEQPQSIRAIDLLN